MAHRENCVMKRCPEKTYVRLADKDNRKRRDLCLHHALIALNEWGDDVVIVDTWNDVTKEQVMKGLKKLKEMRERV